jgi:hypothetical protein
LGWLSVLPSAWRFAVPAKLRIALAVLTVSVGVGVLAPADASAASRLKACFQNNGIRYRNVSTNTEVWTVGHYWRFFGGLGRTDSHGCVTYNVTGKAQNYDLRVRAQAVIPQQRAVFTGISHLYSNRHGDFYDYLGVGRLVLRYLPTYVPPPPSSQHFGGVDTQNWLDEMHGGSADPCTNNPSPGMQVACYMDSHNMVGNVIVLDRDVDGRLDDVDRFPRDGRRW